MSLRPKVTIVMVLVVAAATAAIVASSPAAESGPHWTVGGVVQKGGGTETVSFSRTGTFKGEEFLLQAPFEWQVCKKLVGTGTLRFTSPGTEELRLEMTECSLGGKNSADCKVVEPVVLNLKGQLSAVSTKVYDILEPTSSGMSWADINASEKACPTGPSGEHAFAGNQGWEVGPSAIENTLHTSETVEEVTKTKLHQIALPERTLRYAGTSPSVQTLTGANKGKTLGAE